MRILAGAVLALMSLTTAAHAQIEKGDKAVFVQGSFSSTGDVLSGQFTFGQSTYLTNKLALRLGTSIFLMGDADNTMLNTLDAGVEFVLAPRGSKTVPYVFANFLFASFMSDAIDVQSSTDFTGGVGIRRFLSRQAAFKAEGTFQPGEAGGDGTIRILFGLDYFFGKKP